MTSPNVAELKIDSDGFGVATAVHEPRTEAHAAMILCPGYLDSKDYPHLVALAEACASNGILAARFDPVGTWESEGTEADYNFSRYLQNIASVRSYIAETYGVDKVIVGGHSLGAMVSILYATQAPVEAVVALCPPKEFLGHASGTWQQDGTRHSTRLLPDGSGERTYDVPWDFVTDSSRYSALQAVRSYQNTPLFLLAGSEDVVIPPTEVREIYDAAHESKEYILIDGMSHDYRKNTVQIEQVTSKVMVWLQNTLT